MVHRLFARVLGDDPPAEPPPPDEMPSPVEDEGAFEAEVEVEDRGGPSRTASASVTLFVRRLFVPSPSPSVSSVDSCPRLTGERAMRRLDFILPPPLTTSFSTAFPLTAAASAFAGLTVANGSPLAIEWSA
jgi:hypothetical protein